jgi:Zn-finger nucleic acid-binding protein
MAEPSELLCPSCPEGRLVRQTIRGVELEWCPICHGICLDQGEKEKLLVKAKKTGSGVEPTAILRRPSTGGVGLSGAFLVGDILEGLAGVISGSWD